MYLFTFWASKNNIDSKKRAVNVLSTRSSFPDRHYRHLT